jgi:hypothetical protein
VSTRYTTAKAVVTARTMGTLEGVLLDTFTASAMVAVYEALGEEQRAKFDSIPLENLAAFCLSKVRS